MVRQITPQELARHMDNGHSVVLVDVRQPDEHEFAALRGSVLIPLNELTSRLDEIPSPSEGIIVAYCHHGIRSLSAAADLERHGRTNVYSLAGGIDAWSRDVDPNVPRY